MPEILPLYPIPKLLAFGMDRFSLVSYMASLWDRGKVFVSCVDGPYEWQMNLYPV